MALGLGISFGMLRLFNFAHGDFLMLGLYGSFFLFTLGRIDPYLGILIVAPLMFGVGFLLQSVFINRLIKREPIEVKDPASVLLFTFGFSAVVVNLFVILFSGNFRAIEVGYSTSSFRLGASLAIPQGRLFAFLVAAAMTGGFYMFFQKTYIGKAIRAVTIDRAAARLMGINDYRMYALAFGLSAAILGVSAGSLAAFYYITPFIGLDFLLKSFIIVVLAGVGRLKGILFAGVIIGVLESLFHSYLPSLYLNVFVLLVFLGILLLRPAGLFGVKT